MISILMIHGRDAVHRTFLSHTAAEQSHGVNKLPSCHITCGARVLRLEGQTFEDTQKRIGNDGRGPLLESHEAAYHRNKIAQ